MQVVLKDNLSTWKKLLPLTYTRSIAELRVGIFTIKEKWIRVLNGATLDIATIDYLKNYYPRYPINKDTVFVDSGVIPNKSLLKKITELKSGEGISYKGNMIAYRGDFEHYSLIDYKAQDLIIVSDLKSIFQNHKNCLCEDYDVLTSGRVSAKVTDIHTAVYGDHVFIEEDAQLRATILNSENGPIYIGKGCKVEEGAVIRGPFAMLDDSTVVMGAKMKEGNLLGPNSYVGGEVKHSIFLGNSNKGHDGYLGDSIVGEWCNFGAGTTSSNLKNSWTSVRSFNYGENKYTDTELLKLGLIMGDYTRTAIGTLFNTGTVVGVSCNVFDHQFSKKHIPSFAWGDGDRFKFDKAVAVARMMRKSKNQELSDKDIGLLRDVYRASVG